MNKLLWPWIFILSSASCSPAPTSSSDEPLDIKGLHLGLRTSVVTHGQYKICDAAAARDERNGCFTIGGSPISNLITDTDEDGWIDILVLEFPAASYDSVKAAVMGKYPGTSCSTENVQNRLGAKFVNEECTYRTSKETLSMSRYASQLTTGRLALVSNARLDKQEIKNSAKKSDI